MTYIWTLCRSCSLTGCFNIITITFFFLFFNLLSYWSLIICEVNFYFRLCCEYNEIFLQFFYTQLTWVLNISEFSKYIFCVFLLSPYWFFIIIFGIFLFLLHIHVCINWAFSKLIWGFLSISGFVYIGIYFNELAKIVRTSHALELFFKEKYMGLHKINFVINKLPFYNELIRDTFLFVHPFLLIVFLVIFFSYIFLSIKYLRVLKIDFFFSIYYYRWVAYIILFMLSLGATFLGALWAYYDFNWNGWWIWDSIEIWMYFLIIYNLNFLHNTIYKFRLTYQERCLTYSANVTPYSLNAKNLIFLLVLLLFLVFIKIGLFTSIHNFTLPFETGLELNMVGVFAKLSEQCKVLIKWGCISILIFFSGLSIWQLVVEFYLTQFKLSRKTFAQLVPSFLSHNWSQILFNYGLAGNFLIFLAYFAEYTFYNVIFSAKLNLMFELPIFTLERYCNLTLFISLILFLLVFGLYIINNMASSNRTYNLLQILVLICAVNLLIFRNHEFTFVVLFEFSLIYLVILVMIQCVRRLSGVPTYVANLSYFITNYSSYFQTHTIMFFLIWVFSITIYFNTFTYFNFTLLTNYFAFYQNTVLTFFCLDELQILVLNFKEILRNWMHLEQIQTTIFMNLFFSKQFSSNLYLEQQIQQIDIFKVFFKGVGNFSAGLPITHFLNYFLATTKFALNSLPESTAIVQNSITNKLCAEFFIYVEQARSIVITKIVTSYLVVIVLIIYIVLVIEKWKSLVKWYFF